MIVLLRNSLNEKESLCLFLQLLKETLLPFLQAQIRSARHGTVAKWQREWRQLIGTDICGTVERHCMKAKEPHKLAHLRVYSKVRQPWELLSPLCTIGFLKCSNRPNRL